MTTFADKVAIVTGAGSGMTAVGPDCLSSTQLCHRAWAYWVVGTVVSLVGGSAGDDLKMTGTYQLYDDHVLTDAVVAAGVASDAPLGIGVRYGWRRVGEPMLVTRSSGSRAHTLDDRPALDVYLERLGVVEPPTEDGFPRLALTHPLGLGRPSGEEHVRFIGGADFADGSRRCIAELVVLSIS